MIGDLRNAAGHRGFVIARMPMISTKRDRASCPVDQPRFRTMHRVEASNQNPPIHVA